MTAKPHMAERELQNDSSLSEHAPKKHSALHNVLLTAKLFAGAGAAVGALWMLDTLVS